MKPKKLSYKDFLESFKLVPRVAINLVIKNAKEEILLTKRKNSPYKDYWHIPGSFLHKGEKLKDCIERISKDELSIDLLKKKFQLVGVFEDIKDDPRGHIIDIYYSFKLTKGLYFKAVGFTREIKFFKRLPPLVGFNHQIVLNKLGYK